MSFDKDIPCKVVLFDAAGTLFEPAEPVGETYATMARRCGVRLDSRGLMQAFHAVFKAMPPLAFGAVDDSAMRELERHWWRRLVSLVMENMNCKFPNFDAFFDSLYEHYARGDAWHLFGEVPRVLQALRRSDHHLAVVSNFDSRLPQVLKDLNIETCFEQIVYSTEVGFAKPDRRIFHEALNRMGASGMRALHVGDGLHDDYLGARSARLEALLLTRGGDDQGICREHQIVDLDGLMDWLSNGDATG